MTSASSNTATARPRPNCCNIRRRAEHKGLNTTIKMAAAAVITPPVMASVATAQRPLVGVIVVGRPMARALDNGFTAEATQLCTDGTPNGLPALLGAPTGPP